LQAIRAGKRQSGEQKLPARRTHRLFFMVFFRYMLNRPRPIWPASQLFFTGW